MYKFLSAPLAALLASLALPLEPLLQRGMPPALLSLSPKGKDYLIPAVPAPI